MQVQQGFIVGVYNYCDRWCETCRLTSRCRVFADCARHEGMSDPALEQLMTVPQHPSDARPSNGFLEQALAEIDMSKLEDLPEPAPLPARLMRVVAFSRAYCDRVWTALASEEKTTPRPNDDPYSVILWFAPLIGSKTFRALSGLHEFDGDREFPPDHEGSAKVALIGIDRSIAAWADAREIGRIPAADAAGLIAQLQWLSMEIEELIPRARAFVRPGFDELDEVRKLDATDWS